MKFIGLLAYFALIVAYIFRKWGVRARLLIPLLIALILAVLVDAGRRERYELFVYGIPTKALVLNTTKCYGGGMDVRYRFEARDKQYFGEFRDWDCGEVKGGQYFDLVYLSRAPEIHTWAPAGNPGGRFEIFLLALLAYFFLLAMNAAVTARPEGEAQ